ncbi:hypothetical protein FQN54_007107 [Arachnomyces sp. PD_36]|nr:hypothetical protein FQN54_007107 [Arachnomyces sp. PD_36]
MAKISVPARSLPQVLLSVIWLGFITRLSAASSVIVTTTVFISAPTQSASSSYTSDNEFKDTMLDVTNRYREEHHVSNLSWNDSLADIALDWAKGCEFEHSHGDPGENLAMGFQSLTGAIEAWGDERDMYDFSKPTGFTHETGHFTQLVWKATTTVGCGRVDCGVDHDDDDDDDDDDDEAVTKAQGWYVVCEYWPAGNVVGGSLFRTNVLSTDFSNSTDDTDDTDDTSAASAAGIGDGRSLLAMAVFWLGTVLLL